MRHEAELRAILKQVEVLSSEERRWLVRQLADVPDVPPVPVDRRGSFADLRGLANPEGRTFTDAEVDNLRHEALREKYHL